MYIIIVKKPSSYYSHTPLVEIYDKDKKLFYQHTPKNQIFNLPEGVYYSMNRVSLRGKPLRFKRHSIKPDRKPKFKPSQLRIELGNNPSKASIWVDDGRILLDRSFMENMNQAGREFTIQHEIGHLWHSTERGADLYATNKLLELGYNPSQIFVFMKTGLRDTKKNFDRCEEIIKLHHANTDNTVK